MNNHVNAISQRLRLRQPQRDSLEILARVCEEIELSKTRDLAQTLEIINGQFPTVTDFEREFPSICFALATGVGKTRLMGAFISYLFRAKSLRNYFVLAPNLTIYNKLIADFTPGMPKYVFQGIAEFSTEPPILVTGENYENARGLYSDMAGFQGIVVNIFNISKINAEVRSGEAPKIKRLREYIGESYFEYLASLDDLVLLMDESHRYRATAGVRVLNELNPVLGLELTATPQVESGGNSIPFKNVIYSYPLSSALRDGFVKEPAVATRENFDPRNFDPEALEKLKLEDGLRVHEHTKGQLEVYCRNNQKPPVKPFVLVVAQDTEHANSLMRYIEDDSFFDGSYRGKVITVHSNLRGEERDETVAQLLSVEDPLNQVEIVIHVNMLKEGWDVTNLYTIIPLRAANSKTLVEQSIGRGLRLPFGQRTGVAPIDRLTIVSHDRFQEIVDSANRPDSIIRTGIVIGKDIPNTRTEVVVIPPKVIDRVLGPVAAQPVANGVTVEQEGMFDTDEKKEIAKTTLQVIQTLEQLPQSTILQTTSVQKAIVRQVIASITPDQADMYQIPEEEVARIVAETTSAFVDLTIDIPHIVVVPSGEVTSGFRDFDLQMNARPQPVAMDILIQHLHDNTQHRLRRGDGMVAGESFEDFIVRGLTEFNDVSYDDHAELLYKLAGQLVQHLRTYLDDDAKIQNVLQFNRHMLLNLIHSQMLEHYEEQASEYAVHVRKGFSIMRANSFSRAKGETVRHFRTPVENPLNIRGMSFGAFQKCLYSELKFDSDPERRFAVVLENDEDVIKWTKPTKEDIHIEYRKDGDRVPYEPDFVVETGSAKFLCEPKRASEMADEEVISKAEAAALWCKYASQQGGKPWSYLLIPHDAIADNKTLAGLAASYTYLGNQSD